MEPNRQALFKQVEIAEAALLTPQEMLMLAADGLGERQEIESALENLQTLQTLKREVLNFL